MPAILLTTLLVVFIDGFTKDLSALVKMLDVSFFIGFLEGKSCEKKEVGSEVGSYVKPFEMYRFLYCSILTEHARALRREQTASLSMILFVVNFDFFVSITKLRNFNIDHPNRILLMS